MNLLSHSSDEYMEYFIKSPIFADFTAEEIETFLKHNNYKIVKLDTNESLDVELGKSVYLISGAVATYEINENGKKTLIHLFLPEKEPMIPIDDEVGYSTVSIIAKKPSLILLLGNDSFSSVNPSLLYLQNKFQKNIIDYFFAITKYIMARTLCNTEAYARDKIIRYIKQLYQKQNKNVLSLTLTRSELADHLLMDTSTLMRELKQMKKEGIIDYKRNKITITDTSLLS